MLAKSLIAAAALATTMTLALPAQEAKAPVWEEEPPAKTPSVELAPEEPPPAPTPTPPPPAQGTRNPLALPLRLLALLTLAYAVGFAATHPDADPWVLGGVVLGGLTLALTAWSSATSSR